MRMTINQVWAGKKYVIVWLYTTYEQNGYEYDTAEQVWASRMSMTTYQVWAGRIWVWLMTKYEQGGNEYD